jgi:hypothetical protein
MRRFLLVIFLWGSVTGYTALAQGPAAVLTVGVLANQAQELIKSLENAGATLGGDASKLVDGTTGQLTTLTNQLKDLVNQDLSRPINTLSGAALEASKRIELSVDALGQLLQTNLACILLHREEFLAAVQTTGLRLADKVPFARETDPLVYSFAFDGHFSNIVPLNGGRVTVNGYRLFEDIGPQIFIWDESRHIKLAELPAERAKNADTVSTVISSELLRSHSGEILQLEVIPQKTSWFFWRKNTAEVFLPLVIPKQEERQLQVTGNVSYDTHGVETKKLAPHEFHFDNASCEDRLSVNNERFTYSGLPSGSRIVSIQNDDMGGRENAQIQVNFTNDSLVASGWLDVANCFTVHLGFYTTHRLQDHAQWNHRITPLLEYPVVTNAVANASSDWVPVALPKTTFALSIPKPPSDKSTYWFEINAMQEGKPKSLFASRQVTVGDAETQDTDSFGEFHVQSSFNPTLTNGKCSMRVILSVPECGY